MKLSLQFYSGILQHMMQVKAGDVELRQNEKQS